MKARCVKTAVHGDPALEQSILEYMLNWFFIWIQVEEIVTDEERAEETSVKHPPKVSMAINFV